MGELWEKKTTMLPEIISQLHDRQTTANSFLPANQPKTSALRLSILLVAELTNQSQILTNRPTQN